MEPVALALASNEHYFPGLYCAVTSALCHLDPAREADVRVIDGGISDKSRRILSDLVGRFGRKCRLAFVAVCQTIFCGATPGPGQTHMNYFRIFLPHLFNLPPGIYPLLFGFLFPGLSKAVFVGLF